MKISSVKMFSRFFENEDISALSSFLQRHANRVRTIDRKHIKKIIKPRPAFAHQGIFGHCLLIAGNTGTEGASVLSALAALRSGCGLLTVMIPSTASPAMLVKVPEAMQISRDYATNPAEVFTDKFKSIGIGPGFGLEEQPAEILHHLLKYYKGPMIIDADAITILSKNKSWFKYLRQNMILTPHPVEFDRLVGEHSSVIDRVERQAWFCKEYNVSVILKGHHTVVVSGEDIFINTTGNDGMATAGSGDVLTGILTSLCAQGYNVKNAALLGTFLHGFAGDKAAKKYSREGLIASDIINETGSFFKKFNQ